MNEIRIYGEFEYKPANKQHCIEINKIYDDEIFVLHNASFDLLEIDEKDNRMHDDGTYKFIVNANFSKTREECTEIVKNNLHKCNCCGIIINIDTGVVTEFEHKEKF